ncbi:hypothetical protein F4553_006318 [Allocatelliglobosispora scoriae]|uniref:Uncharacterized protein n=1 Tax=Allocatelliglobosispora scoriae TaxID=643052 RepID=A0A841BXJ7_9ACTN|nr:hypothetical protein [Allocatelliglobosispora scoriae]MBB5872884.1 hypothetical protein [Allocatelliglobosispora scoriae]
MSADLVPVAPASALLARQMQARLGWAADTDEVAAILESTGINDRVADRDYGHSSVFALARQVLATIGQPDPPTLQGRLRLPVTSAMVRAGLYLTPTVVAVGSAPLLGTLPWYATTGLLIAGWGAAQSLAYLGYSSANESGRAGAARRLALGFGALAAIWTTLLVLSGASLTSYLVSAAQLALFAANTAALVTGMERRTLAVASGCWIAAGALIAGAGNVGVAALGISLTAMLVVAYLPAFGRGGSPWRPDLRRYATAAGHGVVGAGQAVLFVLVVLQLAGTVAPAATSAPLLVGVPLTELMLLWHQRRVADGRARLADRAAFRRHVRRVGNGTGLALALPLVIGASVALVAASPDAWAVASSTLLAGINALCLVLVAHRRPMSATALVWFAGALIGFSTLAIPVLLSTMPVALTKGCALILLCLYPPALLEAVSAMKDPWSYR